MNVHPAIQKVVTERLKNSLILQETTDHPNQYEIRSQSLLASDQQPLLQQLIEEQIQLYETKCQELTSILSEIEAKQSETIAQLGIEKELKSIHAMIENLCDVPADLMRVLIVSSTDLSESLAQKFNIESQDQAISFPIFGFGFVFIDRITGDLQTAESCRHELLSSVAHELAHLTTYNLYRHYFKVDTHGIFKKKMFESNGFTHPNHFGRNDNYSLLNEYWPEMTAILTLHNTHIYRLRFDRVRGYVHKGKEELEGPHYATIPGQQGIQFSVIRVLAATIGEADRQLGWPLWKHMLAQVRSKQPYNRQALDHVLIHDLHLDPTDFEDSVFGIPGIARIARQCARWQPDSRPFPYVYSENEQTDWLNNVPSEPSHLLSNPFEPHGSSKPKEPTSLA